MRFALPLAVLLTTFGLYGCATQPEPVAAATAAPVLKPREGITIETAERTIPADITSCSNNTDNIKACLIELNVTAVTAPGGTMTGCFITMVRPDDDLIAAGPQMRGKVIYWKIKTPSFVFTEDDGIDFIDNARPRGFANGYRLADEPSAFRWKNINRGRKVYGYVINVTDTAETVSCFLDPWVRNK